MMKEKTRNIAIPDPSESALYSIPKHIPSHTNTPEALSNLIALAYPDLGLKFMRYPNKTNDRTPTKIKIKLADKTISSTRI